jgi:hypothetical protein
VLAPPNNDGDDDDDECGEICGMRIGRGSRNIRRNPAPVSLSVL